MNTPSSFLAEIPDALLLRSQWSGEDMRRAGQLLAWLEVRGIRPSLIEIEQERQRRTPRPHHVRTRREAT
jgi:hypothetical protein